MVKIFCKNTGTYKEFQEGTMLLDMINEFDFEKPYEIIAARVNNVAQGLKFRAYHSRDIEFLITAPTAGAMSTAVHSASSYIRRHWTFSRTARS